MKTVLEGDNNTRIFHLVANGKHRKQYIYKLKNDQGVVVGDDQLKSHITQFYNNLFETLDVSEITLVENQISDIPQVSQEENDVIVSEFTEAEVREAVFQMEHNKALGPDGFPAEFYQVFWGLIKDNLMALFSDFFNEDLNLFSLNFGIITLIPKTQKATKIQQYRPICVLNVSFEIFTKVGQIG